MGVKIGKKVEDRIFQETENGCGSCGLKDQRVLTVHHIEHGKGPLDNSYDNLLVLCHNCHTMYHSKKGLTKQDILDLKRRYVHKTLTPFGVNALKIAFRKSYVVGTPFTLLHLVELGLLKKEDVSSWFENDDGMRVDMDVSYSITDKGKAFYTKWIA